jgi:hypothetical protein
MMPNPHEQFEAHVRSRAVGPPAILFKYTTVETARIILSTGKLRFQSPLRYNDPFDSQWDPGWPLSTPDMKDYERFLIEQAISDPTSWPIDADQSHKEAMGAERARIEAMPPSARDDAVAALVEDLSSQGPPNAFVRLLRDIQRRLRVLCLCESDESILMWSHYANQHRGVVLGFDARALESSWRCPLESIAYEAGPPSLLDAKEWVESMIFGRPMKPFLDQRERALALTKHLDWRYEREWRIVSVAPRGELGDFDDIAFPRSALVELVTGSRTDFVQSAELAALAYAFRPDVRHFQMAMHASEFKLVRRMVPTGGG